MHLFLRLKFQICAYFLLIFIRKNTSEDILGCGGFVKSDIPINFSQVEVKLFTKQGALKYNTDCAPNNGYYLIPLYDKGEFILKVVPPAGWNFEPNIVKLHVDGVNDPCSQGKDINFYFKGFSISGKVLSRGSSSGPDGVTVTLKNNDKKSSLFQTAVTTKGGEYEFSKVLPGNYIVSATHPKWQMDVSQIKVDVTDAVGDASASLTVAGYDVQGVVTSEGEPIKGVHFLLFSDAVNRNDVRGCIKEDTVPEGRKADGKGLSLCHVTSMDNGSFIFPVLIPGEYSVVPFYKGENIQFDVLPAKLKFTVNHGSVILPQKFEVHGFSVVGRVLTVIDGVGIPGARVMLNEQKQTETKIDGSFVFDGMKAGTYTVQVLKEKLVFDPVEVKITPNTAHLAPIVPRSYEICGHLSVTRLPPGLDLHARRLLLVEKTGTHSDGPIQVRTDGDGAFCVPVERGEYIVSPLVAESELSVGLRFQPLSITAVVRDVPVLGIDFTQFLGKVKGTVTCVASCAGTRVTLKPKSRGKVEANTFTLFDKNTFIFESVLPGDYEIGIIKDEWCWKRERVDVTVDSKDVQGIELVQEGYAVDVVASHETKLQYVLVGDAKAGKVKGVLAIEPGSNTVCLTHPGLYELTPIGCHKFGGNGKNGELTYDTERPIVLNLQATHHLVTGVITSKENVTDVTVTVTSSQLTSKPEVTILGPLIPTSGGKGVYVYPFSHWINAGDSIVVEPKSQLLLFSPPTSGIANVIDCVDDQIKMEAIMGLFITGKVTPALEGVEILLKPKDDRSDADSGSLLHTATDAKGRYTLGPLRSREEFAVEARKEEYVLTARDAGNGTVDFDAFKLAKIVVTVVGENGNPVAGVVLSLSGSSDYRKNSKTQDDGKLHFTELEPGQYFLRPMLKEFSFEPPSTMVDVKEGMTVTIQLMGKRVAFSCYGNITSLTGEPEPGVTVEAVGVNTCKGSQEEATSEPKGNFRIRGLRPGCMYQVRVKKTQEIVLNMERASPVARTIKMEEADVTGMHMIIFRRPAQMEISGNIVTEPEFLNTIKVKLFRDEMMDHTVHTVSAMQGSFFQIPSIPIDGRTYTLRLETSLSRSVYNYVLPQAVIKANTSYRHVTLTFWPQTRTSEHEIHQSSSYALPLTILIIIVACAYRQLLPMSNQVAEFVHGILNPNGNQDAVINNELSLDQRRKKVKARKI